VSHTMMEDEQAKLDRILEKKGESNVASPLEPLIVSLLKGFVDDADLGNKLQTLYKASLSLQSKRASKFLALYIGSTPLSPVLNQTDTIQQEMDVSNDGSLSCFEFCSSIKRLVCNLSSELALLHYPKLQLQNCILR
jgi:hypothetical protein